MGARSAGGIVDARVGRDDDAVPVLVVDPSGATKEELECVDLVVVKPRPGAGVEGHGADDKAVGGGQVIANGLGASPREPDLARNPVGGWDDRQSLKWHCSSNGVVHTKIDQG
jgi:hypothetical protein